MEVVRGRTTLAALLLAATLALSSGRAAGADRLNFLRVEPATVGSFAERVAQTPDGWLWVATRGGLLRHDGLTFAVVSRGARGSPNEEARAVHVSADGVLWVVGDGGVVHRLEGGRFWPVPPAELPLGTVMDIVGDHGAATWIVATDGVLRLRGRERTAFRRRAGLPDARVLALISAADGTPWLETAAGWARLDGGAFTIAAPVLEPLQRARFIMELTHPSGAAACQTTPAPYCGEMVTAVLRDRRARTWIAGSRALWVEEKQRTRRLTSADGLPDDHVRSLFEDREGGVWVTTHGGGLARVETDPVATFTTRTGLPGNTPFGLAEDRAGGVWIASTGGLTRVQAGTMTSYRHGAALPRLPHSLSARRDGSLWMSTYANLLMRFQAGQVSIIPFPSDIPGRRVTALQEDDAGTLWIGTTEGELFRARGEALERVSLPGPTCPARRLILTTEDETCAGSVSGFAPRRGGGLWITTFSAGLHRWDGTTVRAERLPPAARQGDLYAVYEDADGTLWLPGSRGLLRVRDGEAALLAVGDASDPAVLDVVDDGVGFLWAGTRRGLARIARARLTATARDGRAPLDIVRFDTRDGLPSTIFMGAFDRAALRTRDGLLWFSMNTGVAVIDPTRVTERERFVPTVHLEGFAVDGAWTRHPHLPRALDVAAGYRHLELAFAAPMFSGAHRLRFRHRIVGLDDALSGPSASPTVQLAHVRPGAYVLKVQAMRDDRPGRTTELTIPLRLRPLFRQTRAFQVLVGALVVGLLVGGVLLRGRVARARMSAVIADRARIARDLHDSLAQIFAATRLRLGSLRGQGGLAPELADGLTELERMLAYGREEARAVIWQLRSARRGPLSQALEELARVYEGVRVNVVVTGAAYHLTLGAETEVLQIARQAMSNAVEHGGARIVGLDLEYGAHRFALHVRDDGAGMSDPVTTAAALGHHGLEGMRERATRAGGRLEIESTAGVGTEVSVIIEPPPRGRA